MNCYILVYLNFLRREAVVGHFLMATWLFKVLRDSTIFFFKWLLFFSQDQLNWFEMTVHAFEMFENQTNAVLSKQMQFFASIHQIIQNLKCIIFQTNIKQHNYFQYWL